MDTVENRILAITGHTSDINEALDEFENVKEAIGELHDENQALSIINRRLLLCLDLAQSSVQAMEKDASMFITDKTRKAMQQFFDQLEKTQSAIVQSKMMKLQ
jgi:regulator of replication initiation timing